MFGIKREVRCNSGAIPVAVRRPHLTSPKGRDKKGNFSHTTVPLEAAREGEVNAKPEDLPGSLNNHSKLSGERHGV